MTGTSREVPTFCGGCGHPTKRHDKHGCLLMKPKFCPCTIPYGKWTPAAVGVGEASRKGESRWTQADECFHNCKHIKPRLEARDRVMRDLAAALDVLQEEYLRATRGIYRDGGALQVCVSALAAYRELEDGK